MAEAVADTSILVAFSAIHRLDLLQNVFPEVAVPRAVFREIVTDGHGWVQAADIQRELVRARWISAREVLNRSRVESYRLELGAGESEVIVLALETNLTALIDDRRARDVSRREGIKVIGTLGILGRNKQRGYITAAGTLVREMQKEGIYFGVQLIKRFLRDLDEI